MALDIPDEIDEWFNQLTANELEDVSRTTADMAENRRRVEQLQANGEDDTDEEIMQERPRDSHGSEMPEGVPAKATLTKKTINDNEYWYWQWRTDDGTVTSKYKSPVNQG